jgi:hypothetical protein
MINSRKRFLSFAKTTPPSQESPIVTLAATTPAAVPASLAAPVDGSRISAGRMLVSSRPGLGITLSGRARAWTVATAEFGSNAGARQ